MTQVGVGGTAGTARDEKTEGEILTGDTEETATGTAGAQERAPELRRNIDIDKEMMRAQGASGPCILIEAREAEFDRGAEMAHGEAGRWRWKGRGEDEVGHWAHDDD